MHRTLISYVTYMSVAKVMDGNNDVKEVINSTENTIADYF